jgi:hypothetical protein
MVLRSSYIVLSNGLGANQALWEQYADRRLWMANFGISIAIGAIDQFLSLCFVCLQVL